MPEFRRSVPQRTPHHSAPTTTGRPGRLRGGSERGDTPVPSAIIIAGLAVLALVLVGWVFYLGGEFMGQVDSQLPDGPAPVPGD